MNNNEYQAIYLRDLHDTWLLPKKPNPFEKDKGGIHPQTLDRIRDFFYNPIYQGLSFEEGYQQALCLTLPSPLRELKDNFIQVLEGEPDNTWTTVDKPHIQNLQKAWYHKLSRGLGLLKLPEDLQYLFFPGYTLYKDRVKGYNLDHGPIKTLAENNFSISVLSTTLYTHRALMVRRTSSCQTYLNPELSYIFRPDKEHTPEGKINGATHKATACAVLSSGAVSFSTELKNKNGRPYVFMEDDDPWIAFNCAEFCENIFLKLNEKDAYKQLEDRNLSLTKSMENHRYKIQFGATKDSILKFLVRN